MSRARVLSTLPSPGRAYEVTLVTDELTFMGREDQPDFAELRIRYSPLDLILELKSFKKYVQEFRGKLFSYERLCNTIYEEVVVVLNYPRDLNVGIVCNKRGGTSTSVRRSMLDPLSETDTRTWCVP